MFNRKDKKQLKKDPSFRTGFALEKFFKLNPKSFNNENMAEQRIYPTSNEHLTGTFSFFGDLSGKRVLTVGSSGDQLLNVIKNGCQDITLIDGNIYAQFYTEYKIALIKNLEFKQFNRLFSRGFITAGNIFEPEYYQKIFHDLSPEAQAFWGSIFLEQEDGMDTFMEMCHMGDVFADTSTFYTQEKDFLDLKEKLKFAKISYEVSDMREFYKNAKGDFDVIILSNIYDYFKNKHHFRKSSNKLVKLLTTDGKMQLLAHYQPNECKSFRKIFKKESKHISLETNKYSSNYIYHKKPIQKEDSLEK